MICPDCLGDGCSTCSDWGTLQEGSLSLKKARFLNEINNLLVSYEYYKTTCSYVRSLKCRIYYKIRDKASVLKDSLFKDGCGRSFSSSTNDFNVIEFYCNGFVLCSYCKKKIVQLDKVIFEINNYLGLNNEN